MNRTHLRKYVLPSGVFAISQPGGSGPRPTISSPPAGLPGELGYSWVGSDIECLCIAVCWSAGDNCCFGGGIWNVLGSFLCFIGVELAGGWVSTPNSWSNELLLFSTTIIDLLLEPSGLATFCSWSVDISTVVNRLFLDTHKVTWRVKNIQWVNRDVTYMSWQSHYRIVDSCSRTAFSPWLI